MSVDVVANFVQALAGATPALGKLILAHAATASKALLTGLHACNLPFCVYGAVAGVMVLQAYLDMRQGKPDHAQDHALHGFASAILAFVYLLG